MKHVVIALIFSGLFSFHSLAQIVITSSDMPVPGDTLRKSNTTFLEGFDYQQEGADQKWRFGELSVMSQQVDTFKSVSETPGIYELFFNNQFFYPDHKATVALKLNTFNAIPEFTLDDAYLFLKNTDEGIREVGYGVTLEGISIPIQLQQIDTIYRFPLEYGDVDSAHSLLELDIPDLGYLLMRKFRKNTVDGWGTLTTPYGEFQTLRVMTEIEEYDSLYSDSLGVGIPVTRNYTEYKWLANGYHEPVLQVTEEGFLVAASYIDSVRSTFLDVPDVKRTKSDLSVYPNPCEDYVSVSYELEKDAEVAISVFSLYGREIKRIAKSWQERGYHNQVIFLEEIGLPKGIHIIRITIDNIPYTKKIIVN